MPDDRKIEVFKVLEPFEPGDTFFVHDMGLSSKVLGPSHYGRSRSTIKLGVAVENVFAHKIGSNRGLVVVGPEIRLFDGDTEVQGPVVGFVSSFKGDRRLTFKPRSAFRRRLSKMFDSDGGVVMVFMAVLLVLGMSLGAILSLMIFSH